MAFLKTAQIYDLSYYSLLKVFILLCAIASGSNPGSRFPCKKSDRNQYRKTERKTRKEEVDGNVKSHNERHQSNQSNITIKADTIVLGDTTHAESKAGL